MFCDKSRQSVYAFAQVYVPASHINRGLSRGTWKGSFDVYEANQNLTWDADVSRITYEEYQQASPAERKQLVGAVYEWYLTANPRNYREENFWDNWEERVRFDEKDFLRLANLVPPMPPKILEAWYQAYEEWMEDEDDED